jgi:hypothetical protein
VMFDLKIQMSRKPIIEKRLLDITCRRQLCSKPAQVSIMIYFHWQMTHLRCPYKPVAFQESF